MSKNVENDRKTGSTWSKPCKMTKIQWNLVDIRVKNRRKSGKTWLNNEICRTLNEIQLKYEKSHIKWLKNGEISMKIMK